MTTTASALAWEKLRALPGFRQPNKQRRQWLACCPAHDDRHPSLSIAEGNDGRVLLRCQSNGCTPEQIVEALGLSMGDLFANGGKGGTIPRRMNANLPPAATQAG